MKKEIILTNDGSHTISVPEMNITYHSLHGAIGESMHVFIEAGFRYPSGRSEAARWVHVLEVGFGTGLNALLTYIENETSTHTVHYTSLEKYPLTIEEAGSLNYCQVLNRPDLQPFFHQLHAAEWNKEIIITPKFLLEKVNTGPLEYLSNKQFHLIYFDAFSPSTQPELWTKEVFEKMFSLLLPGGILVTYSSKSDVRRAMKAAGFTIEKIQGPWGKREMVRAFK